MNLDATIKTMVSEAVTEQISRLKQQLGARGGLIDPGIAQEGCTYDKGCCRDNGCCQEKGCCQDKKFGLDQLINEQWDILEAFVRSNREPIAKFFKERGVTLKS